MLKTGLLAQTASARGSSRRASWRSRRPPDGPAGALDSAKDGSSWRSSLALKTGLAPRRPLHGAPGALDGPPGAQDGLQTGLLALLAPKTASGRSSWRSRPWVPLLALKTGLLAPKTASGQASWRPRRPLDGPARCPAQSRPSTPELPDLHDNSLDETSVTSAADELSCMSTCFVALCDSLVPQTASGGVSWCQASFRRLCLPVG